MPIDWDQPPQVPWDAPADDGRISVETASDELAELLIECKSKGMISAKLACTIAYWATQCGAVGLVSELGFDPMCENTGNFSRHFDRVVGLNVHNCPLHWYDISVPLVHRGGARVRPVDVSMVTPHDALALEVSDNNNMFADLQSMIDDNLLPRSYFAHPVVQGCPAGTPCIPVSLYLDAVKCTRTENVLGIWLHNIVTSRHHLLGVLRKTELCQCGCRGYCSTYPLLAAVAWSCEVLASGSLPQSRHDGAPWHANDEARRLSAGNPLGFRAAVLVVKGDLAEHCHTLSFTSWAHNEHPCMFCKVEKHDMYNWVGLSPLTFPHELKTHADWETRVQSCEVSRHFSALELQQLKGALFYDRRKNGNCGRCLAVDMFGLQKGDRLEPNPALPFPGSLDAMTEPTTLHFWRAGCERGIKHRNPLWRADLGITVDAVLGIDWLHSLSLGVFQEALAMFYHNVVFEHNVFGLNGPASTMLIVAVSRISAMLFPWYGDEAKRGVVHSRVQNLDPHLFGTAKEPKFDFHGAETNGLLDFSLYLLGTLPSFPGTELWRVLLSALIAIKRLIHVAGPRFTATETQDVVEGTVWNARSASCRFLSQSGHHGYSTHSRCLTPLPLFLLIS
jgi:hypothetical protein